MVTYKLIYEDDRFLIYEYYPEGNTEKKPGQIRIDKIQETIRETVVAEEDFQETVTVEDFADLRRAINEMRAEQNEPELTEEELPPVEEDQTFYCYASKAKSRICEDYNNGIIRKDGMVAWY